MYVKLFIPVNVYVTTIFINTNRFYLNKHFQQAQLYTKKAARGKRFVDI